MRQNTGPQSSRGKCRFSAPIFHAISATRIVVTSPRRNIT